MLYLLTTRLLQPAHRWRFSKKELLVTAAVLLGFAGLVAGGFFATANRYEWVKGAPQNQGQGQAQAVTVAAVPVPERGLGGGMLPTPTPALLPAKLQAEEQANIFAAIARQLYTVDHTFGDKPPLFPMVYLIRSTNDQAGDPTSSQGNSVLIAEEVQKKVTELLGDLPAKIEWVNSEEQVPMDKQTGGVQGGGVIIKFGNIYDRGDGQTFQAAGSIYITGLAAGGKTYILEQVDGRWKINGTTGVEWIS